MDPRVVGHDPGLDALRRRRAELHEALVALEQALAAPAHGRAREWAERVHVTLVELAADFREHVTLTEGPDGLHQDILTSAPRLSNAVAQLGREHGVITGLINDLLSRVSELAPDGDVDLSRDHGTALLGRLVRHRQRGADLIFEAYQTDIGGET